MQREDLVRAAKLALPDRVHLTGISRIQEAGLDFGPLLPLRLVVEGDHHLAIDGIFLHRTKKLAPVDDVGIGLPGAFISYCSQARVIDAIKVGDWLLHQDLMALTELVELAVAEPWRAGAQEAMWVSHELREDSWSLKESETRSLFAFAGLPEPECNRPVDLGGNVVVLGDMQWRELRVLVEYEGRQHQEDRAQYVADIGRYKLYRDRGFRYVLVTDEDLRTPQRLVRSVHHELVDAGYDGPAPYFGERWHSLFRSLSLAVGPRTRAVS